MLNEKAEQEHRNDCAFEKEQKESVLDRSLKTEYGCTNNSTGSHGIYKERNHFELYCYYGRK